MAGEGWDGVLRWVRGFAIALAVLGSLVRFDGLGDKVFWFDEAHTGRVIAGNAGVLLTEVIWVKPGVEHPYVIVDAAMNDLARVALYDAWHDFAAVRPTGARMTANIAGPVCETGDTFALARDIDAVAGGDLAVLRTAGAYGATMASTYNSRPLVPEVLVDGDRYAVVADRIAAETILAAERVPEWLQPRAAG